MLESLFGGLFDSSLTRVIAPGDFLLCIGTSLLAGLLLCATTLWRCRCSRSFAVTLAILPAVVCMVILMVNGNIGTGVAVAGTFNLVRFRSAPGSAREIASLFIAMGSGLISGMGYLLYALLFAACLGGITMLYNALRLGEGRTRFRTLHITIPEDLNYTGVFDPILTEYASQFTLTQVKTTQLGSLFKLTYELTLKRSACEKTLIDQLRQRNGNLEIALCEQETVSAGL